jgi:hypothetical protein
MAIEPTVPGAQGKRPAPKKVPIAAARRSVVMGKSKIKNQKAKIKNENAR